MPFESCGNVAVLNGVAVQSRDRERWSAALVGDDAYEPNIVTSVRTAHGLVLVDGAYRGPVRVAVSVGRLTGDFRTGYVIAGEKVGGTLFDFLVFSPFDPFWSGALHLPGPDGLDCGHMRECPVNFRCNLGYCCGEVGAECSAKDHCCKPLRCEWNTGTCAE